MNVLLIILVFGVIVFFHELGHFLVAKLNKIAVSEFAIGMGPKIVSFKKNGTMYSLRILPLGGYCLMLGEDGNVNEEAGENADKKVDDEASDTISGEVLVCDNENAFNNKPVWSRMMVVLAGPVFNFILAFIFAIFLIHYTGCDPATLGYVDDNGAAAEAGISVGDTIIKLNGKRIFNYRELLLSRQIDDPKADVTMLMEKPNGERYEAVVKPRVNENGEYKLGISAGYIASSGIGMDVKYSFYEIRYWMKATVSSLKMIFTGKVKGDSVMGPVGVGGQMNDIIEEVKQESKTNKEAVINVLLNMLNWCILLSVNLGIMNLLPIPALDGGKLLLLLIEAVRRKKIPEEKEAIVNIIGFVILIGIMVLVFFNDIKNVFF